MYAAILAGGVGTRLWPRSRRHQPKQFSDITGCGRTMIQATVERIDDLVTADAIYVVTGAQYAELALSQLPAIPASQIILEPEGRNTAPAIGLACVHIRRRDPHGIVAILHSDHVILDPAAFRQALSRAATAAATGGIATLGIHPTHPHTGYGYIKRGQLLDGDPAGGPPIFSVERFLEKPDLKTAESFLADGGYYWNGGIFVCRVDVMLEEIARQLPDLSAGLEEIAAALDSLAGHAQQVLASVWPTIPNISIDHGVMEGAAKVMTVPLQAGWNDVGSWDALDAILPADGADNRVAQGDVLLLDSRNSIVYGDERLITLIGVENLVVVDTGDTLLIGQKHQMQSVKDVVERLRAQGRSDLL
jgi:mannose-1-phosphate guanylyltransferase